MATLTLSVPDDLLKQAQARLGEYGHADIEEYLLCALEVLRTEGQPLDPDTKAKLLEALEEPAVEMTREDWDVKLRRFDQRHGAATHDQPHQHPTSGRP